MTDIDRTGLSIETDTDTCACGCGEKVRTKRNGAPATRFRQGDDQRLLGLLIRAELAGQEVHVREGGTLYTSDAEGYARRVFSERGLAKFRRSLELNRERASKRRQPKPQDADNVPSTIRIKVGRWEYEAVREGNAFHYKNAQGEGRAVHVSKVQVVG